MADTTSPDHPHESARGVRHAIAGAAMLLVLSVVGCQRTPSAVPPAPDAQAAAQTPSSAARPGASAMPEAAQSKPASAPPPSPSPTSVLGLIYQINLPPKDLGGATSYPIENGSVAAFWYGNEFELGGKRYFTGFAYDTPEKYGKSQDESYPAPDARVALTQATFVLTDPSAKKAWTFIGAERFVGEFGSYEKADQIDDSRKPQRYQTPDGQFVLALPTKTFVTGSTLSSFAILRFNPRKLADSNDRHWRYLGSLAAGEDNADACAGGEVMPCVSSKGALAFEPGANGGLPAVRVTMSGTTIASPGKTRSLSAADAVTYTYDADKQQYAAR